MYVITGQTSYNMTEKITDTITGRLQKDILRGIYPPGSRFPSERELAELFGASRASVRESVQMLSRLGLLETRPQSGSYVSDYASESSLDLLIHIMKNGGPVEPDTLLALMEFRRVVEVHSAARAAENRTVDGCARLAGVLRREREAGADAAVIAECDYELHRAVIALGANIVTQLVFNSFRPVYRFHTGLFFGLAGAIETTVEQHGRLVGLISTGDAAGAGAVMEEALLYGERRVIDALKLRERKEGVKFAV